MATLIVPNDYATIQAAVNAAQPFDVIQVLQGVYPENVIVNVSNLTIMADFYVVLDGQGLLQNGFFVLSDYVTIKNFTIANYTDTSISVEGNNCTIDFCYCLNNSNFGIHIDSDYTTVKSCKCAFNQIGGLDIGGNYNKVFNNGIASNGLSGIANSTNIVLNTNFDRNTIENNPFGMTFSLAESSGNRFYGNIISAHTGILLEAKNTLISRNVIRNARDVGMQINSTENFIKANQVSDSNLGIQLQQGKNTLKRNIIGTCNKTGLSILSNRNIITHNVIAGNRIGVIKVGLNNYIRCNRYYGNRKNFLSRY